MNIVSNKPSQIVKAGIDTAKTFGTAKISPPKQVARLKAHGRAGITVYMLDGDWFTYRSARWTLATKQPYLVSRATIKGIYV